MSEYLKKEWTAGVDWVEANPGKALTITVAIFVLWLLF